LAFTDDTTTAAEHLLPEARRAIMSKSLLVHLPSDRLMRRCIDLTVTEANGRSHLQHRILNGVTRGGLQSATAPTLKSH
jgi:hypothetical protein